MQTDRHGMLAAKGKVQGEEVLCSAALPRGASALDLQLRCQACPPLPSHALGCVEQEVESHPWRRPVPVDDRNGAVQPANCRYPSQGPGSSVRGISSGRSSRHCGYRIAQIENTMQMQLRRHGRSIQQATAGATATVHCALAGLAISSACAQFPRHYERQTVQYPIAVGAAAQSDTILLPLVDLALRPCSAGRQANDIR